jgi:hypothetical protein
MNDPILHPCRRDYTAAHWSGKRDTKAIRWIVLHDEEAPTALSAAAWFENPLSAGSAHLCVDDTVCYRCLANDQIPWGAASAFGANTHGIHIEQAGYARWSATVWSTHMRTLRRAAYKTALHCRAFDIPIRFVDAAHLPWWRGITTHREVTLASKRIDPQHAYLYTHTDPGPFWPRRTFMRMVRAYASQMTAYARQVVDPPLSPPDPLQEWPLPILFCGDAGEGREAATRARASGFRSLGLQIATARADDVAACKDAGLEVVAWGIASDGDAAVVASWGAVGYLAQIEGPDQRDAALRVLPEIGAQRRGIVTTGSGLEQGQGAEVARWAEVTAVECYGPAGPVYSDLARMTWQMEQYGCAHPFPVVGLYDDVGAEGYPQLANWGRRFGVWRAAQMPERAWSQVAALVLG